MHSLRGTPGLLWNRTNLLKVIQNKFNCIANKINKNGKMLRGAPEKPPKYQSTRSLQVPKV